MNRKRVKAFIDKAKHDRIKTAGKLHNYKDSARSQLHKHYKEFAKQAE